MWNDLLETVKDVAPSLVTAAGTAVGGPLAGGVLGALARKITGAGKDTEINEVAESLLGNPEKLQQFRLDAKRLDLEEQRAHLQDTQDARKALLHSKGAVAVSVLVVLAFASTLATVFAIDIPATKQPITFLLLGTLSAGFTQVLNFWLGSSMGSKEKTAQMKMYADAAQGR